MSGEILILISRCARMCLQSHMIQWVIMYLMHRTCRPKANWKWAVLFIEVRIFINSFVAEVPGYYYGTTEGYQVFWLWYSVENAVIGSLWCIYFFQGSYAKNIVACCLAEAFAMGMLMGAWAIVYRKNESVESFVMTGKELRKEDLWVVLIYILLNVFCIGVVEAALGWMQSYQLKRKGIFEGLVCVLLVNGICESFGADSKTGTYSLTVGFLTGIAGCLLFAFSWSRRTKLDKNLYAEQQRFAETHLAMLQEQASWVSENREQLKEQIQMMEVAEWKHTGNQELLREYLEELKNRYEQFHAGVYCDDRMVDALLCFKEKVCRQQEIKTDFCLQKYDRGNIEEQDVVKLLLSLLDYAIYECMNSGKADGFEKEIHLELSYIKGQLLVNLSFCGKRKFAKSGIKSVLKKYEGTVQQKSSKEGQKMQVMLNCK